MSDQEIDREFELAWNAADPIFKHCDKRDAKYFWLLGRTKEIVIAQLRDEQKKMLKEVEGAVS